MPDWATRPAGRDSGQPGLRGCAVSPPSGRIRCSRSLDTEVRSPTWTSAGLESMTTSGVRWTGSSISSPSIEPRTRHDASLYEIDPLGVVVPRSEDDVVTVVRYASENGIPVHPRGAGTDTGGGALGPGLVVDLSRHFRRIISTGAEHVIVEAGVVPDLLNAQLAPLGRRLEPIVRSSDVTTIGGMIAVDAAGGRSLRYGSTGDQVDWLRVVFAGGEVADLGHDHWPAFEAEPVDFKDLIVRKLQTLYRRGADRIRRARSAVPRNRAGYALARAADESGIHLGRLVAGSEGTLALVTRARLRTVPIPAAQAVVLLPFRRLSEAVACVPELLDADLSPSSCDLLDRRSLHLARDADDLFRNSIDESAESILVVEFEGNDPEEISAKVQIACNRAARTGRLASQPSTQSKRAECERLLGWRRVVESLLMRFRGPSRPVAVFDDAAVAPDRLAVVLHRLQALLQQENITWTLDAYAGEGRLRLRPFLDLSNPRDRARLEPLAAQVYAIVLDEGGTISSSQACGLLRTQFLRSQYGELVQMFREIKDAFDPLGQLNPGKVIGDDPHLMIQNLRRLTPLSDPSEEGSRSALSTTPTGSPQEQSAEPGPAMAGPAITQASLSEPVVSPSTSVIQPVLIWPELQMLEVASSCHGCGACRSLDPALRMCPSFRALRNEAASPRSQANLVRQVATGAVDPRLWSSDEMKAHADLCIHCKLCRSECPSGVDVSSLMLEAKAAYVEQHGLPPSDWIFSRLELWARLGTRFPILTNFLLTRRWSRALLERLLGDLAPSGVAARPSHGIYTTRRPIGSAQASPAAAGPPGRLFRGRLRQLLRPGTRRIGRRGPPACRGQCFCPVAAAQLGHGRPGRRRSRSCSGTGAGQSPRAGQRGPGRLHGGLLRADGGADAPRRIHQADRGPRRRAGRGSYPRSGPVFARAGGPRPVAAPSRALARTRGIPPALSSPGIGCRYAGPRAAAESPGAGCRVHRPRLFRHGWDLWTGA